MGLQAIFSLIFITAVLAISLAAHKTAFQGTGKTNPQAAAKIINEIVPVDALVETYESEIMFLAPNVRYHYPPDQVSVRGVELGTIDLGGALDYNPITINPDFLLVGDFSKTWKIYDTVLKEGAFKLQDSFFGYDLYSRIH